MANPSAPTFELENDIQRTREEITETTRALSERLAPKNIWARFWENSMGQRIRRHRGTLTFLGSGLGWLLAKSAFRRFMGGRFTPGNIFFLSATGALLYFERLKYAQLASPLSSSSAVDVNEPYFSRARELVAHEAKRIESAVRERMPSVQELKEHARALRTNHPQAVQWGAGATALIAAGAAAWGIYVAIRKGRELFASSRASQDDEDFLDVSDASSPFHGVERVAQRFASVSGNESEDDDSNFQTESFTSKDTERTDRPPY